MRPRTRSSPGAIGRSGLKTWSVKTMSFGRLRNAIRMNRIAQAYLFCGTRGVGKTSMARIFAKCLNCVKGPTEEPCQTCDICQSIALGQDVDVIEIDGASNNGVEQVRELRQNAALRPSRARYKIYYIDEVHMLSTGAFNALLKTLEEPPPHVKFFFATTEANKIPITVLSRCQRYDFAGITPEVIAATLGEICRQEHVEAEPEALQIVARRASGSLRDAQSLLDRLLASGSPLLTVEVVNGLLGTASDERLLAMIEALADHDAAAALRLLEQSAERGRPAGGNPLRNHRFHARCPGAGRRRRVDAAVGLAAAAASCQAHRRTLDDRLDPGVIADPFGVPGPDARQFARAAAGRAGAGPHRAAGRPDRRWVRSSSGSPRSSRGRPVARRPDLAVKTTKPGPAGSRTLAGRTGPAAGEAAREFAA